MTEPDLEAARRQHSRAVEKRFQQWAEDEEDPDFREVLREVEEGRGWVGAGKGDDGSVSVGGERRGGRRSSEVGESDEGSSRLGREG